MVDEEKEKGIISAVETIAATASGGVADASIGGSVVAGVCAVGGTIFGPAGTFFEYTVGTAVGGGVGSIGGFAFGVCGKIN